MWLALTLVSGAAAGQLPVGNDPVTATDLSTACRSSEAASVGYCEGYIAIFAHIFKIRASWESDLQDDQFYGNGFDAAEVAFDSVSENCPDCDANELRAATEACSADAARDRQFCAGYNSGLDFLTRQDQLRKKGPQSSVPGRDRGADDALMDLDRIIFMWMSDEIPAYLEHSCVRSTSSTQEVRDAFLQFLTANSEDQGSNAMLALAKAQFFAFCGENRR